MRRGRRKGGNKEKVFGCDLSEHLSASPEEIPLVLKCCSEFIEEHGIVDGIYRLSGVSSNTVKLRSEFEGEGSPDLNKDVYLQDIHCVSSLCKAYFRELPNPLLTYQLYDKFAEAVAIHLEEERLVKIKEVLKELPCPNYRTLEYLMRHLVRMAAHASQTNMHARNLAIVWAPNLLRSKDIEATGLNGTAAFMEVRVQSVVVEFILTHVPQLFPEPGRVYERRQSLPSPTPPLQDEKSSQMNSLHPLGTISPGDGPLPMRPYHAIIESTDKRKGSLKGKKWTFIFNLGGRLSDPKKKSKCPRKDKEKMNLRPAKSMDSLNTVSPSSGSRQRPPVCQLSLANQQSSSLSGEVGATGGPSTGSSYAVTYRRGGGASVSVVSGTGTPGTYNRLDSGGAADTQYPQPKSPASTSKAERRAGMHISGPFSVTVPLHITSGLALGVLQSAPGERGEEVLLRKGEDREVSRKEDNEDMAEYEDMKPLTGQSKEAETEIGTDSSDRGTEEEEEDVEEEEEAVLKNREEERRKSESMVQLAGDTGQEHELDGEKGINGHDLPIKETQTERAVGDEMKKAYSDPEGLAQEDKGNESESEKAKGEDKEEQDYIEMKGGLPQYEDSQEFPLDFQDTFGFLDHIDSSTFNQMNEFSVEPPCYDMEDEEELVEEEARDENLSDFPHEPWNQPSPGVEDVQHTVNANVHSSQTDLLKIADLHSKACKSHSLPYKSALHNFGTGSSDDDLDDEADDQDEDNSDDEEDRLFYSLPADVLLSSKYEIETEKHESGECAADLNDCGHQPDPAQQDCKANLNISTEHLSEEELKDITAGFQSSNQLVHTEAPGMTQVDDECEEGAVVPAETAEQTDIEAPADEGGADSQCTADPEDTPRNSDKPDQQVEINNEQEKDYTDVIDPSCGPSHGENHTAAPWHDEENEPQTETVQTDSEAEVKTERDILEGHRDKEICTDVCSVDSVNGTNLVEEAIKSGVQSEPPSGLDESQLVTCDSPVLLLGPCELPQDNDTMQEALSNVSEEFVAAVSTTEEPVSFSGSSEEHTEKCSGSEDEGERIADKDTAGEEMSSQTSEEGVLLKVDNEECQKVDPLACEDMDKSETIEADGVSGESERGETGLGESMMGKNGNKEKVEEDNMKGKEESDEGEGISNKIELKEGEDEKGEEEPGVGMESERTLAASDQSQQPKMHHAKPVPMVPPKTKLSKLAALNLRQQLQHRGNERGKEGEGHKDKERDREGQGDVDRERVEGEKEGDGEIKKNSTISMCFDEAVARATERRGREKEEREREKDKEKGTDEELKQRGND